MTLDLCYHNHPFTSYYTLSLFVLHPTFFSIFCVFYTCFYPVFFCIGSYTMMCIVHANKPPCRTSGINPISHYQQTEIYSVQGTDKPPGQVTSTQNLHLYTFCERGYLKIAKGVQGRHKDFLLYFILYKI